MKSTGRRATTDIRVGTCALSVGMPPVKPKDGWSWVALSEVAQMATGHTPSRNHPEYWKGEIAWMTVSDARWVDGATIWSTKETINELGIRKSAAVLLPARTVCLSRTGSIGYAVILGKEMATSQGFVNWICGPELRPRFLQLIFQAESTFLHQISEGVAHTTIYFPEAKAFHVCKPAVEVQDLICEHIDLQLSRLDAGITALKRAQAKLKRYRASVLQAACEGRLVPTEHALAQAEERDYETGTQLLQRTLTERRQAWTGKGKYKEPSSAAPDFDLDLPDGWAVACVDQMGEVGTGATPKRGTARFYEGGTIPWVTSGALNDTYVDSAKEFVTDIAMKQTNLSLYPPGTLLVAMYGEGKTRGKCSELRISATTNQAIAAIEVTEELRPYVKVCLLGQYEKIRFAASGGVQPNLNLSLVREIQVKLPPLAEQVRIVAEVERRLSVVDQLESTLTANLHRATRLRQAILKKAFSFEEQEPRS